MSTTPQPQSSDERVKLTALRRVICLMQGCPFRENSDAFGIWGECQICHKRVGYVTRERLRQYTEEQVDRALAAEESIEYFQNGTIRRVEYREPTAKPGEVQHADGR